MVDALHFTLWPQAWLLGAWVLKRIGAYNSVLPMNNPSHDDRAWFGVGFINTCTSKHSNSHVLTSKKYK